MVEIFDEFDECTLSDFQQGQRNYPKNQPFHSQKRLARTLPFYGGRENN